mgnify:CR=1 FL=1
MFVKSKAAKEKLQPALAEGNRATSMAAPATDIIGYDMKFYEKMERLFPHVQGVRGWFDKDEQTAFTAAFRNGTLQGAIFPRGDADWYALAVDQHGELQVTIDRESVV